MNKIPLIPRKLNLGIERLAEVALSMREPMVAQMLESNGGITIFLKNKNGIILYRMTVAYNDRELFFNKLEKHSEPEIVSYDLITEGYERWMVEAYTN